MLCFILFNKITFLQDFPLLYRQWGINKDNPAWNMIWIYLYFHFCKLLRIDGKMPPTTSSLCIANATITGPYWITCTWPPTYESISLESSPFTPWWFLISRISKLFPNPVKVILHDSTQQQIPPSSIDPNVEEKISQHFQKMLGRGSKCLKNFHCQTLRNGVLILPFLVKNSTEANSGSCVPCECVYHCACVTCDALATEIPPPPLPPTRGFERLRFWPGETNELALACCRPMLLIIMWIIVVKFEQGVAVASVCCLSAISLHASVRRGVAQMQRQGQ